MFTLRRHPRKSAAAAAVVALVASLAACTSDTDGGGGDSDNITLWLVEDLPDRVAATERIIADFTQESGVNVEVVPVGTDQFAQLLTSAAAAGDLPDAVGAAGLVEILNMAANDLLDTDATAAVVESLGEETFDESALELTRDGDTQLAVPSESWTQLLVYRKDLFDQAGLEPPTSYDAILAAAAELDSPEMAGFVGASIAGDVFTEQTFEHVALGNDCQLVDEDGEVAIDSSECAEAFDFYGELISDYSVSGGQDVDTTRAAYFAGEAAMIVWSTFILDEMAGLRDDALPNCPECQQNPAFLAENSGVVTAIQGPSGAEPAVFGEITSWAIPIESASGSAQQLIEYMMSDGYERWIAIAPEGKVPVRAGNADNPTVYIDRWAELPVGVDTKAPLTDFYGQEVIDALATGPDQINRWAIPQGQGELLGAIQGTNPIAQAVNEATTGGNGEDAASTAGDAVREVQESLQ